MVRINCCVSHHKKASAVFCFLIKIKALSKRDLSSVWTSVYQPVMWLQREKTADWLLVNADLMTKLAAEKKKALSVVIRLET